ncbi:mamu class II histocompatibility antigen, DR alpha chain-like, partial [Lycodopsis pacificus]
TEAQCEVDAEELLYVYFDREEVVSTEEKNPPEEMDPPESILYPSEEVQLGVENILICFVNHFYPPEIKVSCTRNGRCGEFQY